MADNQPDDPALYPPDTRSEAEANSETTPEYLALLNDLSVYHNSEAFSDSSLPQLYKLYIRTAHLPDVPFMLDIDVNGNALPTAILEGMIAMVQSSPGYDKTTDELRAEILAECLTCGRRSSHGNVDSISGNDRIAAGGRDFGG